MCHDANVYPWMLMARDHGLVIRWLPFDTERCEIDPDALDSVLTDRTRLVCVGGASNLLGTVNDVAAISRRARDAGAWTWVDAVQSAPHVPTDVQAIGCDFLAVSAYKFFGPHQGILWGRQELLESLEPYKLRPAPDAPPGRFETGTQSHEGMAGTRAAVDYFAALGEDLVGTDPEPAGRGSRVRAALAHLCRYEETLSRRLVDGLSSIAGIAVHGITDPDAMSRRVPTVAFTHRSVPPAQIARALGNRNIFVWSGHNYAVEPAKALGIYESGGAVRVGAVHYNTPAEVDTFLAALEDIVS
jgi:cysteine desulfurase family protein (TIGR01976 family)